MIEKNQNAKFEWGEVAKIKSDAPQVFRPHEIVSVCGMTLVDSEFLANKYSLAVGEWVYTIEYQGGLDTEIPEKFLEKY